jgi:hypothetical protein
MLKKCSDREIRNIPATHRNAFKPEEAGATVLSAKGITNTNDSILMRFNNDLPNKKRAIKLHKEVINEEPIKEFNRVFSSSFKLQFWNYSR